MAPITPQQAEAGQAIRSMVFTAGFWPRIVQDKNIKAYRGTTFSERSSEKSRFVFAEGVNVLSKTPYLHNPWKLSGNRVWYQFADSKVRDTHEIVKGLLELDGLSPNPDGKTDHEVENLKKFLRGTPDEQMMGVSMAKGLLQSGGLVEGESRQQVENYFAEKEYFLRVFNQFKMNNSKYTGTYLSDLMKQLKKDLRSTMGKEGATPKSGKMATGSSADRFAGRKGALSKTAGALMREEQTRVVEGGRAADTSGLIGMTQPIDTTYVTQMGRVHIDVSEMPIYEGGHHGLSAGRIMSPKEAQELAEEGDFNKKGGLRDQIYDYYQARIPEWNKGIEAIRNRALAQTGGKTVGPGAMRRAGFGIGDVSQKSTPYAGPRPTRPSKFGPTMRGVQQAKFGKTRKTPMLNYGVGGRATKRKLLRNASVSAKKLAQHLFSTLNVPNLNQTAATFIMHGVGTFNQHKGKYYHTLTVSKDPHVTGSVFFQMFSRNAKRAYEYKELKKERDVKIYHGFASLNILQSLGAYESANYVQTVSDMSDVHLVARYIKNVRHIVRNTVMSQGARSGKGFKLKQKIKSKADSEKTGETFEIDSGHGGIGSCAVYVPTGWTEDVIARTIEIFEGRFNSTGAQRAGFRSKAKSAARPFQEFMENIQEESHYGNTEVFWPRTADFWASPYFGVGYEPPLEQ